MTSQNEIQIHAGRDSWMATYVGPHAAEIKRLFGTDTIPTAFTRTASLNMVCREVCKLNPGAMVGPR